MKTRGIVRKYNVQRGEGSVKTMDNVLTGRSGTTYWIYARHIMCIKELHPTLMEGQWIEFDVYENAPGVAYNIRRFGGQGLYDPLPQPIVPPVIPPVVPPIIPPIIQLYRKHLTQLRFKNEICKLQSSLTAFVSSLSSCSSS